MSRHFYSFSTLLMWNLLFTEFDCLNLTGIIDIVCYVSVNSYLHLIYLIRLASMSQSLCPSRCSPSLGHVARSWEMHTSTANRFDLLWLSWQTGYCLRQKQNWQRLVSCLRHIGQNETWPLIFVGFIQIFCFCWHKLIYTTNIGPCLPQSLPNIHNPK